MKFKVVIKMKKPYTAVYLIKPTEGLAIEAFGDLLKSNRAEALREVEKLLEVEIVEIKEKKRQP